MKLDDESVTIRLLESPDDPLFWPALEFYVESFPRDERESLARVAKVASGDPSMCRRDGSRLHMAVADYGGRLAGIRYFSYNAGAKLGFFIYLAVEPELRRRGIGARLVEFGKQVCRVDAAELGSGLDAIVFECERPELADCDKERAFRERRLAYFKGLGAIIVSTDYYQPALGPDRQPVPLYILAYPISPTPDWPWLVRQFHRAILHYPEGSDEELKALAAMTMEWRPRP